MTAIKRLTMSTAFEGPRYRQQNYHTYMKNECECDNEKNTRLSYKEVYADILRGNVPPPQLAEYLIYLAGEYSYWTDEYAQLLVEKPAIWNELRKGLGSDKAAERAYDATERGAKEIKLRMRLKALEKLMSAIKTSLRVKEVESRNQF